MKILQLIEKYPDVNRKILQYYKRPEKSVWVNTDDPDLEPIELKLPQCPDYHKIDGFGLPAHEQKWQKPKYPERLRQLEKILSKKKTMVGELFTIDDIWDYLDTHREDYSKEIDWIKFQWNRRLNGYWFFNNGVPTYIDGWHYFYCGFWRLDTGFPEYRSRDKKFFLFARFCFTDTRGIKKDADGEFIKKNGKLQFFDTGYRVCFGFNYGKHRREGATYKAECINYEIISRMSEAMGGIQSMTGDSARKAFQKHLVRPWKKLPFFFKPNYDGSTDPKKELIFDKPGVKIGGKGSLVDIDTGLQSVINYAETSDGSFYDGEKLYFYHGDEVGKTRTTNIRERHDVVKECLSLDAGMEIVGLCINTSTVEELIDKGGQAFYDLSEDSHFEKRDDNNQTNSGVYNLFISSIEGLSVDEYGNSVIDDPKKSVKNSKGKLIKIGSKTFLNNRRKALLESGSGESMQNYYNFVRRFPMFYAEMFVTSGEDSGFPKQVIIKRINELNRQPNLVRRGNYEWTEGFGSKVVFVDKDDGKFYISKDLPKEQSNLKILKDGVWCPQKSGRFTACGDPFKFNKPVNLRRVSGKTSSRLSNGGGSVFWERDVLNDPDDKDVALWDSHRFVCTYSNRVDTKEEYCEDMLKMCIFWGALMYPEIDLPVIWDYFIEKGYGGFLKYDIDEKTGKIKDKPGYYTGGGSTVKQAIFVEIKNYLEVHGHRERHFLFLKECRDIKGMEEMTKYDQLTACGGALLGSRSSYSKVVEGFSEEYDIRDYVKIFKY